MDSYTSNSSSSLHSVRRAAAKPWRKLSAPLPPAPPRVYKVEPINFRDLVQRLTAAPEYLSASVKPPAPVDSSSGSGSGELLFLRRPAAAKPASLSNVYKEFSDVLAPEKKSASEGGFLGLNLSPATAARNWCSFPMLSPGTLSTLEL